MKRKVIQIAESTQLISLPRKWAQSNNIKKGDELEISEGKGVLTIFAGAPPKEEKIFVNVTGLDRSSIILLIRCLYKKGYDEIKLTCNTPVVTHHRTGEKKTFLNVVHLEVNRLPGFEVVEQKDNYCILKAISEPTLKDLDTIIRRLLLLTVDMGRDVIEGASEYDRVLLETIEEKHDSITKFTSYSMRLLNKGQLENQLFLFGLLNLVDKAVDHIKNSARLILMFNKKCRTEVIIIMEEVFETFSMYNQVHFKMDFSLVSRMSRQKEEIRSKINIILPKLSKEEAVILETFQSTLEMYRGMVELRMAMIPSDPTSL